MAEQPSPAPACGHPRGRCRRLQPADGRRRGRHAEALKAHRRELIDPRHRQPSRPHRQDHRRRHAGRIRQRRRCGRLRGRHPARHGRPQRGHRRGHSASSSASASTSATSSSTATTFSATASTSPPGWKRSASRAGVCISRAANDQIRDKLSLAFADLGEQAVKNIARAVGVFGLAAEGHRRHCPNAELRQSLPEDTAAPAVEPSDTSRKSTSADRRRRPARLCSHRPGAAAGQDRQLDDPSRIRSREPDLAASLPRAARDHHAVRYDARGNGLSDRTSTSLVRGLRERSGGGGRRRRPRAVRAVRDLPGLRGLDRLCGAPSRAGVASDPLRRFRVGWSEARPTAAEKERTPRC